MATIAEEALRICHFDPASGVDVPHLLAGDEVCEAACYDCLMSYYNQPDHRILDRRLIRDALLALRDGVVKAGPGALTRAEHLARLYNLCGSQLERDWLDRVDQLNLRLPNDAQRLIESCGVSPDFYYDVDGYHVAVFVDGPHHDDPAQQAKDIENDEKLWNAGIEPIHFHYLSDWAAILAGRKGIFGQGL